LDGVGDGTEAGAGLVAGWMVIIDVRRRVSGGEGGCNADVAVQNCGGCGELVECCFCFGISGVSGGAMWKTFVPRGTFAPLSIA
jgi:hypothetical protein